MIERTSQFIIIVPGTVMDCDGRYDTAENEEEMHKKERYWKEYLGFSKVVVYEKISENR